MSEQTAEPSVPESPTRLAEEHKQRLLVRARGGRPLTLDDLAAVMPRVEITEEVVLAVQDFLAEHQVPFDGAEPRPEESTEKGPIPRRDRTRPDATRLAAAALARATTSSDPVKMYLKEIGKVSLLSAAEEVAIAKRIETGAEAAVELSAAVSNGTWDEMSTDARRSLRRSVNEGERARRELTSANLRLVVSIAKRYVGRGVPILDLIQEGNLGLMRAVQKFDYSKGFKFSTYATWWIRQSITRALADQSRTIRVPVHMVESINKVVRAQRAMAQDLEREPTLLELAREVDLPEARVAEILTIASQDPLSLDSPVGDEDDTSMADFIADGGAPPLEIAARKLLEQTIRDVLDELSDRESEVVRMRFGLIDGRPRTLEEVGKEFGVTRERIRQIESKTLAKLRHPLRSERLRDYLD